MPKATDPLKKLARAVPKATRKALEATFVYWLENIAPEHFKRRAFSAYSAEYADSAKKDLSRWQKTHEKGIKGGFEPANPEPAVDSGRFEQSFLHGSYLFSAGNKTLKVRWPTVPKYVSYRNRFSGFQPSEAVTAVNDRDYAKMWKLFRDWLAANMKNAAGLDEKSYGQAVVGD